MQRSINLEPGREVRQQRNLWPSRRWVIEFDRGGPFGHARYAVGRTKHTFTPTENGWELFQE